MLEVDRRELRLGWFAHYVVEANGLEPRRRRRRRVEDGAPDDMFERWKPDDDLPQLLGSIEILATEPVAITSEQHCGLQLREAGQRKLGSVVGRADAPDRAYAGSRC